MASQNKVQGKVVIVTGGAGEATALLFAENGARAVVIADVQDEKGQKLAGSIDSDRSTFIHCDVTDEKQVKSLVESTVALYGHLDIMFCKQMVVDFDLDMYEKLFAVNVRGMAASVKHAARAMVGGVRKGSIICTASIAATTGGNIHADYVLSKCTVLGLV